MPKCKFRMSFELTVPKFFHALTPAYAIVTAVPLANLVLAPLPAVACLLSPDFAQVLLTDDSS